MDPRHPGPRLDQPFIWIIVVVVGLALGALIGGLQGFFIAFIGIPSFVVTLGGLLVWRGAAFQLASGRTIAPLDPTFQLLGGGPQGSLGETLSWVIAGIAIVAIGYGLVANRRRRRRYGFPLRPIWADVTIGVVGEPPGRGRRMGRQQLSLAAGAGRGSTRRERHPDPARAVSSSRPGSRSRCSSRSASPSLMTFLATRRRFGRYVYSHRRQPGRRRAGRHQHAAGRS